MKKEKEHLIFVEVDWAIIHCLTFSFDYGRIHCGIVLISFCPTSQDSFLSRVAFIFHHHLVKRLQHIPESGWGEGLHSGG